jgi:hypothetical protein
MKVELSLSELQMIASWGPKSLHPSTQELKRKIDNIVLAAKAKEGEKYIDNTRSI